ncbi:alpha/beta hydrolase family protein [Flavobacterium sp.]|uniref:alpha/beta hydrolase family protein n=1 Tax=Flavobacterium sp. TaxID=239 RepID=UPI002B4B7963|nr:YqiA/YcfP family alpha/beta fold hydrolase [Flavobacterium sp.]HLF51270.1 YqiA/YcfP family alpha/beta fold hydrolase [Flavobacterium sp.]
MKKIKSLSIHSFILLFLTPFFVSVNAQEKLPILPKDYLNWKTMNIASVSPSGKWVSYQLQNEVGVDTLFVRHLDKPITYTFPSVQNGMFSASDYFAVLTPMGLELTHLVSGKVKTIQDVQSYAFSKKGNELVVHSIKERQLPRIEIHSLRDGTHQVIEGVTSFQMSPDLEHFVYAQQQGNRQRIGLVSFGKKITITNYIASETEGIYDHFQWSEKSTGVVFHQMQKLETTDEAVSVCLVDLAKKNFVTFSNATFANYPSGGKILSQPFECLYLSDDLSKVYFAYEHKKKQPEPPASNVEVWQWNSPRVYTESVQVNGIFDKRWLLWDRAKNAIELLNSDALPKFFLAGKGRFLVSYHPYAYEPQFDFLGPVDYYLTDLHTQKTKLLLAKHSSNFLEVLPSPGGKYILYFKDKNWWYYDLAKELHLPITKDTKVAFYDELNDLAGDVDAYGVVGWTAEDRTVLLYDRYDIWEFEPKTGRMSLLTEGRNKKIVYRLPTHLKSNVTKNFDGYNNNEIEINNGLFLMANTDNGDSGFCFWEMNKPMTPFLKAANTSQFHINEEDMIYIEQRFDLPPQLMKNNRQFKESLLVQSNPGYGKYDWGRAVAINYTNSKGQALKGYLCYPSHYEMGKQYPMIVHIYQKQFRDMHIFEPPSLYPTEGFFASNYTTQGYFVFFPDIVFDLKATGSSALDCTLSGVNAVLKKGEVNRKKIGLVGHSFGGYEANYIATQTDLFAAIVSGAGVVDLPAFYLNMNWRTGRPDMWRMEFQQWRMGCSLFEDRNAYALNSPLSHVESIKSPLLLWSGKNDMQVDWRQNVTFYLALRRLKKQATLLLYPDEYHSLEELSNRLDLRIRLEQWFAHYLKDESPADWIKEGI